jgi:hypothetical protein
MRWTDVPAQPALRPADRWLAELRSQQEVDARVLEAIVAKALAASPGAGPLVALQTAAIRDAWDHVRPSLLERGGLLLGEAFCAGADEVRVALVYVRAAVQSREGDATPLSLRMDAGVWDAAREALRPGEVVVGWYHSHPGIGAFFSDTDRRTQAGFFSRPFSLGWVIDPQRAEQAWFVGPQAQPLELDAIVPIRTPSVPSVLPRT